MKRLIILLIFLFPIIIYSQTIGQVYSVESGPWNPYTETFEITLKPSRMRLIFENSVIHVTDVAHSVYILSNMEEIRNDYQYRVIGFDGIDEKSRTCRIILMRSKYDNVKSMSVIYEDFVFTYYYN